MTVELTCRELVELVTEYLEGTLPPAEKERFEEHLKGCSGCQSYLAQMRTTIRLTGKLSEDNLAPVARDEMLNVFRHWRQGSR
jgi:anti-sigma factor RsiW